MGFLFATARTFCECGHRGQPFAKALGGKILFQIGVHFAELCASSAAVPLKVRASRDKPIAPRQWRRFPDKAGLVRPSVAFPFFRDTVARRKSVATDAFAAPSKSGSVNFFGLAGGGGDRRAIFAFLDDFDLLAFGDPIPDAAEVMAELADVGGFHVQRRCEMNSSGLTLKCSANFRT